MPVTLKPEDCEVVAILAIQKHLDAIGANDNLKDVVQQLTVMMFGCTAGIWSTAGKKTALDCIDAVRRKAEEFEEAPPGESDPGRHPMPGAMQ